MMSMSKAGSAAASSSRTTSTLRPMIARELGGKVDEPLQVDTYASMAPS